MTDIQTLLDNRPPTVGAMFNSRVAATPDNEAIRYPDAQENWVSLTWAQMRQVVWEVGAGLLAIGLQPEERVAIASNTRYEWVLLDLAINCAGGATTTVYPNTTGPEFAHIITHSESKYFVAENVEQLEKLRELVPGDQIREVILLDGTAEGTISKEMLREKGRALLADLCLDADLAMLHDARDVVPGLQELVDAHRSARPSREEVHSLTFDVVNRGYNLLLGLRRHRDWTVLKPRTFESALTGLLASFDVVVADVDDDLEGEAQCGSIDVEERNVMARTATTRADVVVAVGGPGLKGLHGLVRTINRLREHGVAPGRILAVVNRAPKAVRLRSDLARAFADLTGARTGGPAVIGPIHLPERRGLDELLRDGARLPQSMTSPLVGALGPMLGAAALPTGPVPQPVPIAPGSLGVWAEEGMAPS